MLDLQKKIVVPKVYLEVSSVDIPRAVAGRKSVYFVKHAAEPIENPVNGKDIDIIMSKALEWGILNGRNLVMLEQVISQIYLPLIAAESVADNNSNTSEEFLVNLRKFASHMRRTIQQVDGDVKLKLPSVPLTTLQDTAACISNPTLLVDIERHIDAWTGTIGSVIDVQIKRTPVGKGPLAELDYWVERSSTMTALYEQLQVPEVQAILAIVTKAGLSCINPFENQRRDLMRLYTEAKDNVKFLSTLERHFKNLTTTADLNTAAEIIPSVMNALRMVWIISRHYNTDQRMVPLMERVAWLIADKVARRVDIHKLFKFGFFAFCNVHMTHLFADNRPLRSWPCATRLRSSCFAGRSPTWRSAARLRCLTAMIAGNSIAPGFSRQPTTCPRSVATCPLLPMF